MRTLALALGLAAIVRSPLNAQLAPVNELGLSIGHMHIFPGDREREAKAWLALGGQLEYNLSNNIPIGFPGIIVLIGNPRAANLGSAGSVIDHVAFRVPNLDTTVTRVKGIQTWWKNGTWGWTIEPGATTTQAFATTPGGIRVEILEDKSLKVPIVFDHVHYYTDEARLKPMEDYYAKMFGAKPVKGKADTLSMPGGNLIFSKADAPPLTTTGRTLDHVGFNMLNGEALAAYSKVLEEKGAKMDRPYAPASMGMTHLVTDFGTNIEVTKAQNAYFDPKLLDQGYYLMDEGGRKGERSRRTSADFSQICARVNRSLRAATKGSGCILLRTSRREATSGNSRNLHLVAVESLSV